MSNVPSNDAPSDDAFTPTREELLYLAAYWTKFALDQDVKQFYFNWYCSGGYRGWVGWRRLDEIEACLGDAAAVEHVVKQAADEFGAIVDPELWRLFRHGTPEEILAMQEELLRAVHGEEEAREHRAKVLEERRWEQRILNLFEEHREAILAGVHGEEAARERREEFLDEQRMQILFAENREAILADPAAEERFESQVADEFISRVRGK